MAISAFGSATDINNPVYLTNTYSFVYEYDYKFTQYNILTGQNVPTLIGLTILGIFALKAMGK